MTKIPFTYRLIRYVHDPSAGEMLNVGVLLYAPSLGYFGYKFERHYGRLSSTFVDFGSESYRRYIGNVEAALGQVAERLGPSLGLFPVPEDLEAVTRQVLPDVDGSLQPGEVHSGITDDPAVELELIFERMIASQYRGFLSTLAGQRACDTE